ncbi:hypothetical protein AFB00_04900 [Pseudonocardia sp. HH130630-07]|nr:hypothetical protein AFB00_04900 [Pseudonocardia sp. HH130630-07]
MTVSESDSLRRAVMDAMNAHYRNAPDEPHDPDQGGAGCPACQHGTGDHATLTLNPDDTGTGDACPACGQDAATFVHTRSGWTGYMHPTCAAAHDAHLTPACVGAADLCGAGVGERCEPWCPSWATDPIFGD